MSPGKKSRGAAAATAAVSAPSTTAAVPQMFSLPLMPNALPHALTAADALTYFPRPSESLEQMQQRNQFIQRQMLLAAGQQLTPV